MTEGRLFYMAGASDVGKDQLMRYARTHLRGHQPVMFAHRYSTRRTDEGGDNQVALTEVEFALRKRLGLFVMDWESSGLRYGIGTEINYWLAMGLSVVVNGSHAHLDRALEAYPDMTVIWVSENPDVATAPREARLDIATPLAGDRPGRRRARGYRMVHISHNGSLPLAGEKLVSVLADQNKS